MGNFLLKNLDKNTNSIVDICFDDVVVLDVDCGYCGYQILRKVYIIFEKLKFLKNYVQNTNLKTSGTEKFFKD